MDRNLALGGAPTPSSEVGGGGTGGGAASFDGQDGRQYNSTLGAQGGGGGGAGRLRFNTTGGGLSIATGAVLSPSSTADQCDGLCSTGTVASW